MSVSIEALAMAGTDYLEWGMDVEEWERYDVEPTPPHLLADDDEDDYHEIAANLHKESEQRRNVKEMRPKWLSVILMVKTIMRFLMVTWVDFCERYYKLLKR